MNVKGMFFWGVCSLLVQSQGFCGEGEKDLFPFYPGAKLVDRNSLLVSSVDFPVGLNSRSNKLMWETQKITGKNSVEVYRVNANKGLTVLGVYQSIFQELGELGAVEFFSCSGISQECGYYFPRELIFSPSKKSLYSTFEGFENLHVHDYYMYSGSYSLDGHKAYIAVVVSQSENSKSIQYSLDITVEGQENTVSLVDKESFDEIAESISKTGSAVLRGIHFETDKVDVTNSSRPELEKIAKFLSSKDSESYLIVGHTDSVGNDGYNSSLSLARANSVLNALVGEMGVSPDLLDVKGLGRDQPIANNSTVKGRAVNRRVELLLTGSDAYKAVIEASKNVTGALSGDDSSNAAAAIEEMANKLSIEDLLPSDVLVTDIQEESE